MKSASVAAFALSFLCPLLCYPQTPPPHPSATSHPPPEAKVTAAQNPVVAEMSEEELRRRLTARPLFLRGLWLDDTLHFDMNGKLVSQSPKGSFTLCGVLIDHIHETRKQIVMEGIRYGVHFEDEGPWKDQATAFDRIQVTPKKKHLTIVIDRQIVVTPKEKGSKGFLAKLLGKGGQDEGAPTGAHGSAGANGAPGTGTAGTSSGAAGTAAGTGNGAAGNGASGTMDDRITTSPAESAERLRKALNGIFAPELDAKMVAEMPDYWQYFYQAQQDHKGLVPSDPDIVRPGPGITVPKIVKNLVPQSNDYAQRDQVAGVASYKVILGTDGKPLAVAVYRPIGFGLDENAVAAIDKSTFTPAMKDGKPVKSVIDLAVEFRIYSKLTSKPAPLESASAEGTGLDVDVRKLNLPGPFTAAAEANPARQQAEKQ